MGGIRVLIVDDEAPARRKILFYLRGLAGIEIMGECRNGREAVAAIQRDRPDVVFLDVQMPGMGGFDVVRELQCAEAAMPLFIFVTAYDEFAVRAFEVMALDYLVKPFSQGRFEQALDRARAALDSAGLRGMTERLRELLEGAPVDPRRGAGQRLLVRNGDRTVVVATRDIHWVAAANNYLEIHTAGGTFLLRKTMGELETELAGSQFVRIHRSTLVSVRQVKALRPLFNRDHMVTLHDGTQLVASRTYYDGLMAALTRK